MLPTAISTSARQRCEQPVMASIWDDERLMWNTLSSRITEVQQSDALRARLASMRSAFILIYDVDTDDEQLFTTSITDGDVNTVIIPAFEDRMQAEQFASAMLVDDDDYVSDEAFISVLRVDLEDLAITSSSIRDVHVAVQLTEDDGDRDSDHTFQLVPEGTFPEVDSCNLAEDDRKQEQDEDAADELLWVLVHDMGTADALVHTVVQEQGSVTVLCFEDPMSAMHCGRSAATQRGAIEPLSAVSLTLAELLEVLQLTFCEDMVGRIDIYRVKAAKEALEMLSDATANSGNSQGQRAMLNWLFKGEDSPWTSFDAEY